MNRKYIIPSTNVVVINFESLVAVSPIVDVDPEDPGVDPEEFDTRRKDIGFGTPIWSDMK